MTGKRYLRPDTGEIVEVLRALGGGWLVGTRKPNGSIKRLKSSSLPVCPERRYCQDQLDRYVQIEKKSKWPVVEDTDVAKTAVAKRKADTPGETPFDYGDLVPRDVAKCEQAVEKIAGYQRRMAGDIVAIGKELIAVKERLEHGQFGPWLQHYFGWSQPTASRMMQAASTFKSFNLNSLSIDQSALYLLSSDKCPDEIREEVLERAEQGERISHASVKQALTNMMGDDDEPPAPRRRSTPIADDDQAEPVAAPPPSRLVPSDSWNIAECLISARRWLDPWRDKCPEEERGELAQILRDLAEQIERSS
jgi:hypothetical protein